MDLQQEQLARSLGDGHRVIHGVAGSGKTMILSYRAEYLAKASPGSKPVLVLCYNQPLAVKLDAVMAAKGLADQGACAQLSQVVSPAAGGLRSGTARAGSGHVRSDGRQA